MPLVRFQVRSDAGLGDPDLYGCRGGGGGGVGNLREAEPGELLEGVAVAGLVGVLRQLGDLAEFAADIFHDLHEKVINTSARGHKVLTQVQNIEAALPSLEKAAKNQTSNIHFAYVPGSDWHAQLQNGQNYILSSDLPQYMDSYEECQDLPRLYLLDKFDNTGVGACFKRYSDPSYFKRAWDMMKTDKTENVRKEKRTQKIKRKGLQLKNAELFHGPTTSRLKSSELQLALSVSQRMSSLIISPSTDGRKFSENKPTPDARSNPEIVRGSASFGSKARSSLGEQALDTRPAVVPDENNHDKSSDVQLQHDVSDASSSIIFNSNSINYTDDCSKQEYLSDEMVARSSSVTWDEKAEIIMTSSSVYCDDDVMDKARDTEPIHIYTGQQEIDDGGMENFEHHHDEVSSETDNYMDVLDTLESQTETEDECQTKDQVKSIPSFDLQLLPAMEMQNLVLQHHDSSVTEVPYTCETSGTSHISGRLVDNLDLSNAYPSEISEATLLPYAAVPTNVWFSVNSHIPENNMEGTCGDISDERIGDIPSCEPTIYNTQVDEPFKKVTAAKSSPVETIHDSPDNPENSAQDSPGKNDEEGVGCGIPSMSDILTDEVLRKETTAKSPPVDTIDDSPDNPENNAQDSPGNNDEEGINCGVPSIPDTQTMPPDESLDKAPPIEDLSINTSSASLGVSSIKLWTNAGLFGLEPSKPPVFGAQEGPGEDIPFVSKGHRHNHSTDYMHHTSESVAADALNGNAPVSSSFMGKLLGMHASSASHNSSETDQSTMGTPDIVRTNGPLVCSTSFEHSGHYNMIKNHSSISEIEKSQCNAETHVQTYPAMDMIRRSNTSVLSDLSLASKSILELGPFDSSKSISSSFTSIAQRFLSNTLQRRNLPNYTDLPTSERMNSDASAAAESTLFCDHNVTPKETMFQTSQCEESKKNVINGLSRALISSTSHYSEQTSPPLEYMKISFHPMNTFEMSNLNLEFSNGNLEENADDLMVPTFQLLPGSSVPVQGSGSESENDTFCRFSYSSYDDLSPPLYSNSEQWDQEDGIELDEHELYNNSNQIVSSTMHVPSHACFEQLSSTVKVIDAVAEMRD